MSQVINIIEKEELSETFIENFFYYEIINNQNMLMTISIAEINY